MNYLWAFIVGGVLCAVGQLFIATGALMSQTTFLQKESIPAVAHLVELTAPEKES